MSLHELTLTELSAGLAAKRFSSREVIDALLSRIEKADGKLHAFTEVYAKEARAIADGADTARATGFPLPPLHGRYHLILQAEMAPGMASNANAWAHILAPRIA